MRSILVKGGTCVNPDGRFDADVLIEDGKIAKVGQNLIAKADETIDAVGKLVLPGGVDVHVHLPWPTGETISMDTISTGTLAAACGGVTTVIDFVIPNDGEPLIDALERKLSEAQDNAWVDYSFHVNVRGAVTEKLKEIPEIVRRGFPSFKIFMAYEGFRLETRDLLEVMETVTAAGGMISSHAEDGLLADHLTSKLTAQGNTALRFYPQARPNECESAAIANVLAYAARLGSRIHIHHVSTADGVDQIARARRAGVLVSAETCPHYLLFTDMDYAGEIHQSAGLVCAPPIKGRHDQDRLWEALSDGTLDAVATDHCPYSQAQKFAHLDDFTKVPGGLPGVETRLPLLFTRGVGSGRLSLEKLVELWSAGPARAFGLYPRKGLIAVGSDGDLTLIDPARSKTLKASELHMHSDCLPYEGWEVQGWPPTTILGGKVIVTNGTPSGGQPGGNLIPRYLR